MADSCNSLYRLDFPIEIILHLIDWSHCKSVIVPLNVCCSRQSKCLRSQTAPFVDASSTSRTLWQVEPCLMPCLQILSILIFLKETFPLLSIAHLNSVSISDTCFPNPPCHRFAVKRLHRFLTKRQWSTCSVEKNNFEKRTKSIKTITELSDDEKTKANLVTLGKRQTCIEGDPFGVYPAWAGTMGHPRDIRMVRKVPAFKS